MRATSRPTRAETCAPDFAYLSGLLARYGLPLLALARPVPVLAEASVIAAGVLGLKASTVLLVTALANIGFATVYAGLGASAEGFTGFLLAFALSLAIPGVCAARGEPHPQGA